MALTPLDIHHKEFKTARFGGYNEEEVDSFLDLVADEFERLIQESVDLKQQIEHSKKRLADFEEMQTSLQSALLAATKSAEAVKDQAKQESEAMVGKAQEEADSLVKSAQEQSRQMILRAQSERQKLERSFANLKEIKQDYLKSIRDLADAHLAQVSDIESREDAEADIEELSPPEPPKAPAEVKPPPLVEESLEFKPPQGSSKPKEVPEAPPPVDTAPPAAKPQQSEGDNPRASAPVMPPVVTENNRAASVEDVSPPGASNSAAVAPGTAPEKNSTAVSVKEEPEVKAPSGSNLVDEVLAMDGEDDIYDEFTEEEKSPGPERVKKSRKEKRDKHFFWE